MKVKKIKPPGIVIAIVSGLFKGQKVNILLSALILSTAFILLIFTHQQRKLYAELEFLEKDRDRLDIEWRQLRLEQRVMAEHSRLEKIAQDKLGMKILDLKSERIVRQVKDGD